MRVGQPYSQRALIKDRTPEQVYEVVSSWLVMNGCAFKHATPPNYIESLYQVSYYVTQVGLTDGYPKEIAIRLTEFGSDTLLQISVTQKDPRYKERGYLYWGSRIEGLLWELESPPTREQVLGLYPREMVEREIRTKFRFYTAVTAALVLVLMAFRTQLDVVLFFLFVFIAPVIVIGVIDTIDFLRLRTRTAAENLPST